MTPKVAYMLGGQLALDHCFEGHSKTADIGDVVKNYVGRVLGSNVDNLVSSRYQELIKNPVLRKMEGEFIPGAMDTTHAYIKDVLRGSKTLPAIKDIPRSSQGGRTRKLVDAISRARDEVLTQQQATRMARLGTAGAVALPIGAVALSKSSALRDQEGSSYLPSIAGAGVATLPMLQGLEAGAVRMPESGKTVFKNVEELKKAIQEGDIMLTGNPSMNSLKAAIIAAGGDPHGYHTETVASRPNRKGWFNVIHSHPKAGGASRQINDLLGKEDVIVRRFKDPAVRAKFMENMENAELQQDLLGNLFGEKAQISTYNKPSGIKAGIKDLLPRFLRKPLASCAPGAGNTMCSSLPATRSPVELAPGIPAHEVLPHHIQKSDALETIGHYYAPRSGAVSATETALRGVPTVARGLLGAGLGYGAYRGLKSLMEE
jgi:hypothetical protein